MQPYGQTPSLEKICSIFSYNPNEIFFLCAIMSMEKAITILKNTVSYVVAFSYGKGLAHCMCNHVFVMQEDQPIVMHILGWV